MKNEVIKYNKAGLKCLPVKKDKSPDINTSWLGGIDDLSLYKNGVGIICGKDSHNLEVLDFDNHFGDAKENLSKFISEIKDIYNKYKFPIQSTQSGGFHLLYRCEKIEGSQKLANKPLLKNDKWIPDAIIESKGENSYIAAYPTDGYKWIRNNPYDIQEITQDERKILIETAKSFNQFNIVQKDINEDKDKPGDLFNQDLGSKQDMVNCLKSHGWTEIKSGYWRRPDKKSGISATIGKVADNIFYNFSANAYPFDLNKAYTPFQVIALLEHNGDFSEFARILAEKYKEVKPVKKQYAKQDEKPKDKNQLEQILSDCFIDLSIPVQRPPVAIEINDFDSGVIYKKRLFTLGNFSAITGKSKSKKSMLTSVLLAAATSNESIYNKLTGTLPDKKRMVILFDTEQSSYDAWIYAKRTMKILNIDYENFGAFEMRDKTPLERCELIAYAFEKMQGQIGYAVIDGIADLVKSINDEDEAIRVVTLLMGITKKYNCHITLIIHQNKNDTWATGHIGSAILKKCEVVMSVIKDENQTLKSKVCCDMIRGTSDFSDFEIEINDKGIPVINDLLNIASYETKEIPF